MTKKQTLGTLCGATLYLLRIILRVQVKNCKPAPMDLGAHRQMSLLSVENKRRLPHACGQGGICDHRFTLVTDNQAITWRFTNYLESIK